MHLTQKPLGARTIRIGLVGALVCLALGYFGAKDVRPALATHCPSVTILGTSGEDDLTGLSDHSDLIKGELASDKIRGEDCADELRGGDGPDNIFGGSGNDVLYGNAGNEGINYCAQSNNWCGRLGDSDIFNVYSNRGDDDIHGGQGNDNIFDHSEGPDDRDEAYGEDDNDVIRVDDVDFASDKADCGLGSPETAYVDPEDNVISCDNQY